jgi:hypothetical protein
MHDQGMDHPAVMARLQATVDARLAHMADVPARGN